MITNFEEYTHELTEEEAKLVPLLVNGFKTKSKSNPIKASDIVSAVNSKLSVYGLKKKFSEPRLRKIVNLIRSNGILPLMGTSKGYYVSYDKDEIKGQIESLTQRADAIMTSASGLKKFI